LIDDQVLLRQSARRLLEGEPDFEVVGEADNAATALEKLQELRPDLVLMNLSSRVLRKLVQDVRVHSWPEQAKQKDSVLTRREREVLRLLAQGNSVKKAASILGLSAKTVEAHKFNLMRKLDIHNKAQLVTFAIQEKIVSLPISA
jgi:DNA-binding NarL/FixJ family response regulator